VRYRLCLFIVVLNELKEHYQSTLRRQKYNHKVLVYVIVD
jgi:hypothetical protein